MSSFRPPSRSGVDGKEKKLQTLNGLEANATVFTCRNAFN